VLDKPALQLVRSNQTASSIMFHRFIPHLCRIVVYLGSLRALVLSSVAVKIFLVEVKVGPFFPLVDAFAIYRIIRISLAVSKTSEGHGSVS